jgi:TonB family protein
MAIFVKLRTVALLIGWTLSGTSYSATLSRGDQQPATPQPDTNKQPEQAKPIPRPNPDASGNYHVGDGVTAPRLIFSVEPEFTEKARKRKINGNVTVQLIVDTDGHVRDAHVIKSSAENMTNKKDLEVASMLDQKAVEAVSQYRFKPATFQGKPVPVEARVEVYRNIF